MTQSLPKELEKKIVDFRNLVYSQLLEAKDSPQVTDQLLEVMQETHKLLSTAINLAKIEELQSVGKQKWSANFYPWLNARIKALTEEKK